MKIFSAAVFKFARSATARCAEEGSAHLHTKGRRLGPKAGRPSAAGWGRGGRGRGRGGGSTGRGSAGGRRPRGRTDARRGLRGVGLAERRGVLGFGNRLGTLRGSSSAPFSSQVKLSRRTGSGRGEPAGPDSGPSAAEPEEQRFPTRPRRGRPGGPGSERRETRPGRPGGPRGAPREGYGGSGLRPGGTHSR
ncbi:PREDICTED: myosin heavy chain IB [Chinchilla lanigera]|uniref:myosin heavy chain IB n=1 Tax=Chinchilla lanigera TaxID=34839 RepID=UPI00069686BD|nr:PREDICTED: myosin heavy chain IB [Chinchilla lanigera]